MESKPPLITQKMQIRYAIGLFVIAGLLFGWHFLSQFLADPDVGTVNSTGWIVALREEGSGERAVILKPDGSSVPSPDFADGIEDRDPVWQPDGQRIFVTTNRGDKRTAFNIFRWNPTSDTIQARTVGSRPQGNVTFAVDGDLSGRQTGLLISSGLVNEFDPKTGTTKQLIPFVKNTPTTVAEEGGGVSGQLGDEFTNLGTSFRLAQWCRNKKYIVGVMRREGGETLVLQNIQPATAEEAKPRGIVAGSKIDFAIDPKTGNIVYTVQDFDFVDKASIPKQYIQGDKVVKPYKHLLAVLNPDDPQGPESGPIVVSDDDQAAFAHPAVSPSGATVVFSFGAYQDALVVQGLAIAALRPVSPTARPAISKLYTGFANWPNWSPDGEKIVFTLTGTNRRTDVCTVGKDGAGFVNLTSGQGVFSIPSFSPETVAPASSSSK